MDLADVRRVAAASRARGVDPLGALERQGLILTDDRRNQLVRQTARELADTIEKSSAAQLGCVGIPRNGGDMQRCIVAFIRRNFGEEKAG